MLKKQLLGRIAANLNPQCKFDRAIFVIGHMRCGSTALSNILCSRPDISGYGEAHIAYRNEADLGVLALNQWRRGAWKPDASIIFDKILHSRYDCDPPTDFFGARAIFLARAPGPTIASIRDLFGKISSDEYQKDGEAEAYYQERLRRMFELWDQFPPENRIGVTYERLVQDPEASLGRISRRLAIMPPLANTYCVTDAARSRGAGDPLSANRQNKIVRNVAPPSPKSDNESAYAEDLDSQFLKYCEQTESGI
jgi:LPS sulfotransferase NodH